ncbi:MAG: hypothetical protein HY866_02370, partial [Chloroflexi bacterium]|nr:hypothetical protein [Chloroflexota bacterium]
TEGGGPGFTAERGLESFYYNWRYVALVALGPAALLAAIAGQILTLRRWRDQWQTAWLGLALILYMLVYTALALPGKRLQANLLLPLLLPIALLAGSAFAAWWDRWRQHSWRMITLFLLIGWPGVIGLWFTTQISTTDNRLRAQAWIYEHIPRGTAIHMLEPYNVPLDPLDYQTEYTYAGEVSAEKVSQSNAQIIVYSDSYPYTVLRDTALSSQEVRAKEIAIKNVLATEWIELKRFKRLPWPAEKIAPDDVSYWHQMEIVIYCNPADCPVDLSQ